MKHIFILLLFLSNTSCNSQEKKSNVQEFKNSETQKDIAQIGNYVTSIYKDSNDNLWFGTIEKGIAKYNGKTLKYLTKKDGLPSNRVISVREDKDGNLWFATGNGISKYDGKEFTNYLVKANDFYSNTVNQIFIDGQNGFWLGTWGGVYKFDGKTFKEFSIPIPEVEQIVNQDTKGWVTEITEDLKGNLWFARSGYGISIFDGDSFTHFLKKDGLHSNQVTEIEFDIEGNAWIGTRIAERDDPNPEKRVGKGGLNKSVGNKILSFPEIKGLNTDDVHCIYKDSNGYIWIGTKTNGVFQFNGKEFKQFDIPISIMSMMDEQNGKLWLSGAGGLYRIDENKKIVNVTKDGPWE
jgi:ligand-binding sensor domain-containing protein